MRYLILCRSDHQARNLADAIQDIENNEIVLTNEEIQILPFNDGDEFVMSTMSEEDFRKMIREQKENAEATEYVNSLTDKPISEDGINPANNTIQMGEPKKDVSN